MSWQTEREGWNRKGLCARQACKESLVSRNRNRIKAGKHKDNGLYYCVWCTRLINDHNPLPNGSMLIDFVRDITDVPFAHVLGWFIDCSGVLVEVRDLDPELYQLEEQEDFTQINIGVSDEEGPGFRIDDAYVLHSVDEPKPEGLKTQ